METEKSPGRVKVRPAKPSDAVAVHALAGELATVVGDEPPSEKAVRARLGDLISGENCGVLVAEVAGESGEEVAGAVSYWIKPDLAHGDSVVEIPMLAVAKGHRRGGVGKTLLAAVSDLASEASLVELIVVPSNTGARDFYRSLGFVETDHLVLEFVGEVEDFSGVIEQTE
ncbi:GNAT family N-acetyltransferase [Rubrobacter indicoceani]|uniref:GNAT family N-acetyltransferase n=1 Tax=Rubrobacter indicoceani TaxID=2051957 RepID=UPI000E5A2FBC|nr:N-acetyltransferase [Rubrobacter indicoceani]